MVNKPEGTTTFYAFSFIFPALPSFSFGSLDEDSDIRLLGDELRKSYFIGLGREFPSFR